MPPLPQIAGASSSNLSSVVQVLIGTTAKILVGMTLGVAVCVALVVALLVDPSSEAHT